MILGPEEGEDDNVSGNNTDKNTLNESVVGDNLGTGGCVYRCLMMITTGWREGDE